MANKNYAMLFFIGGLIIGILACNIIFLGNSPVCADTSGQANNIIAVTGLLSNNYAGLWVIDSSDSKTSPSLCLYMPEGRNGLRLIGARRIKYDLKLLTYQDRTRGRDLHPANMKVKVEEMNKKEEDKVKKKR